MRQPLVSIIIVTYHSEKYITDCLNSLAKITYPNYEIIIIDNNTKNLGYATANNLAALKAKGQYLFFLNPDTQVTPDFLDYLVAKLEANSPIAVVQPAVYLLKDKNKLNLTGKITHYLGMDWIKDYLSSQKVKSQFIYSFSGSAFLIRKNIFLKLHGFDNKYFMYYEDSDLSWKINLAGQKIYFENKSIIYHDYKYEPLESYQKLSTKIYYAERNRLLNILKNYERKTLILLLPAILLFELSMLVYALATGWGFTKIKIYAELFELRKHILKQRKFIKQIRKVSDQEILKNMQSEIKFVKYEQWAVKKVLNPALKIYWRWLIITSG